MTAGDWLALLTAVLAATGFYLALPRPTGTGMRLLGYSMAALALLLLWGIWDRVPGKAGLTVITYTVGTLTLVSGFMMITRRSPVAAALWFAAAVVGGAVLMFAAGAQFVGATTTIVYAGAVIVMFLFVIMLAQQQGLARCDREAHEPALAALTFLLLAGAVLIAAGRYAPTSPYVPAPGSSVVSKSAAINPESHVAGLGGLLFSEYAIAIEVVGTLLLVAMVAAVVIAARWRDVDVAQRAEDGGSGSTSQVRGVST